MMDVRIEASWKEALKDEFGKSYFISLAQQLHREKAEGRLISVSYTHLTLPTS